MIGENLGLYMKIDGKFARVISIKQAGKMLGISPQAVLKKINRAQLPAIRITRIDDEKQLVYFVPKKAVTKLKKGGE